MPDPLFHTDAPLSLEIAARQERDRYLAYVLRTGYRSLVTRLFGTPERALRAAEAFQECYVKERGMTTMPNPDTMAARSSNDQTTRDTAAA